MKRVIFISFTLSSMRNQMDALSNSCFRHVRLPHHSASKANIHMLALYYAVDHEQGKIWKFVSFFPFSFNACYCKTNLVDNLNQSYTSAKGVVATVKLCELTDGD